MFVFEPRTRRGCEKRRAEKIVRDVTFHVNDDCSELRVLLDCWGADIQNRVQLMTTKDKHVSLFVPTFRIEECLAEIRDCLEVGWTGQGNKTLDFERAWMDYTGMPNAHFLNSASAGLFLAIQLLKEQHDWADGDEIISTPITFVSTNHAIAAAKLRVVFADIDDTGCLDPDSVATRITPRTRAVVFVGLGGQTGQYEAIEALCQTRGLKLVLDAAHMSGTRLRGKTPGLGADATVYSFQAVKNLPTADAGMICLKDAAQAEKARRLSWLGIDKDTFSRFNAGQSYAWMYDVPALGYNIHGNAIMAAIALVQLRYLESDNSYRREVAGYYDEALRDNPRITIVPGSPECTSSRHLYQVRVENRDDVIAALNRQTVFPGVHYRDNTDFSFYQAAAGSCPRAHAFSQSVISMPLHLRLQREDVMRCCQVLHDALS